MEGFVEMRRYVCVEVSLMFLTKPVVSGFPPHAGIPALVQQLLGAVLSFPAAAAGPALHHCSAQQGQMGGMLDGSGAAALAVTAAGGRKWGAMSMHTASSGCLWLL